MLLFFSFLKEVIQLTKELVEEDKQNSETAKQSGKRIVWKTGDKCSAIYRADGK